MHGAMHDLPPIAEKIMDHIEPITPRPASASPPVRLTGIRRGLATFGLAIGLLAVGGAAVVMAASPEPSSSTTPGTTPSTQPSTTDDDSTSTDRPARGDCPEDAEGQDSSASPSSGTSS
jgi:hypothetical protein